MWFSVLLTVKIMHRESFKWIQFIKALKQIFTLWWCHVQNNSIHYLYFWSDYWNIHLNRNISKKKKCITKKKTGSGLERNYCFSFPDDEQSHWQTNWLCFCSALLYLCRTCHVRLELYNVTAIISNSSSTNNGLSPTLKDFSFHIPWQL